MILETLTIYNTKKNTAQLIKELRKKNGLTQAELAEKLNVSRITIQNMEAAQNVTLDTFLKALQYFHLLEKFNDLITVESEHTKIPSLYK
jgi:transcriptional regulator with XRE-family HTH domain